MNALQAFVVVEVVAVVVVIVVFVIDLIVDVVDPLFIDKKNARMKESTTTDPRQSIPLR